MKKIILSSLSAVLFLTAGLESINAQLTAKVATNPAYPTVNKPLTIYLDTKHWPLIDTTKIDVYTGLITTSSSDFTGSWQDVVPNAWGDHPDSLKMKRVNDSIYSFTISSITSFYKVKAGETVFRIAFIARDQSATQHQTENLYFEVFDTVPSVFVSAQPKLPLETKPMVVTANINLSDNKALATDIKTSRDTNVYVYTAINSGWTHEFAKWDSVLHRDSLKTISVNDSVYRFYIFKSPRLFYKVTDTCEHVSTVNLVFRNKTAQTGNGFIKLDSTNYKNCATDVKTIKQSGLTLSPNPVEELLTVSSPTTIQEIRITNIMGQLIQHYNNVNNSYFQINLSNVKSGVYFISVRNSNNTVSSMKFIKR